MSAVQLSQENMDTNASASAFGWDFQSNAAILLALKNIKNLISIKVEGKIEDIEIYLEENKNIYVQAKSQENPTPGTNTLTKLKDSLKTLINASNQGNYEKVIYITNISNPFNNRKADYYWGNDYIVYSYDDLYHEDQKTIDKYIKSVTSSFDLKADNFDVNRLEICSFPFYGKNLDTRYRIISAAVRRFVNEIQLSDSLAQDLLDYWQKALFQNATNRSVSLTKKELVWPLIVLKSTCFADNPVFDDYDIGQIDEIRRKFDTFINKKSEQFEFVTKVISEFNEYRNQHKHYKNNEIFKKFINENWFNYSSIENINCIDEEIIEGVIKLVLHQVLSCRYSIDNVKKVTGL